MANYYLHNGQAQTGPFSIDELKEKSISADTPVWTEGLSGWQRAADVNDLRALFVAAPPPFTTGPAAATPPPFAKPSANLPVPPAKRRRRIGNWGWVGITVLGILLFAVFMNTGGSTLVQSAIQSVDHRREMRVNWTNYLAARRDEGYHVGVLGGISNLKVLFDNNSDYMMNEMTASITYIKANGDEWRTIPTTIYNVPPHTHISHPVADVLRGVNVRVTLTGAVGREAEFSMINGYDSGEPGDPYHMR